MKPKESHVYTVPSSDTHNPTHLLRDMTCDGCGLTLPINVLHPCGPCRVCGGEFQ